MHLRCPALIITSGVEHQIIPPTASHQSAIPWGPTTLVRQLTIVFLAHLHDHTTLFLRVFDGHLELTFTLMSQLLKIEDLSLHLLIHFRPFLPFFLLFFGFSLKFLIESLSLYLVFLVFVTNNALELLYLELLLFYKPGYLVSLVLLFLKLSDNLIVVHAILLNLLLKFAFALVSLGHCSLYLIILKLDL